MKLILLLLPILIGVPVAQGQASSSDVAIITTYSQNQKYHLKSVPYDHEFPTLRGKTSVYSSGNSTPLYEFDRGFDSVDEDSNNLILSNDGEVIFFAIPWEANEAQEGLKSITIYKHGKIIKSFTETEVNGCDKNRERCSLLYSNYDAVVDQEKSNFGAGNYKKVFKDGVDEKERFLSDFHIFAADDIVYLTDSKKNVHLFDLRNGSQLRSVPFDNVFDEIRGKARLNRTELTHHQAHIFLSFPKLKDRRDTYEALASYLGMRAADLTSPKDEQYKLYSFTITLGISRDGTAVVESIDADPGLPKSRILAFFKTNRFDISAVPSVFDKWYLTEEFFSFRNATDKIARQERLQQLKEQRAERERRMIAERINDVYIPRDLGECFIELDRLLSEIDKNEMRALPKRENMIGYHLGLGMWMRNNWGLWGGSRLYKYFHDKAMTDPEDMSSIVLFYYYDWLTDKKSSWKEWEARPKRPFGGSTDQRFTNEINKSPKP